MQRILIQVTEKQLKLLDEERKNNGESRSSIVRKAIIQYYDLKKIISVKLLSDSEKAINALHLDIISKIPSKAKGKGNKK